MAENATRAARPADAVGRALFHTSRIFVLIGGTLLILSALLTTLSILTHAVLNRPIRGEFELVSFGTSWAVYFFLPYCQIVKGNVIVDFFFARAGPRVKNFLDAIGSLLYTAIVALLVWRMSAGAGEIFESGQESAVMNIPYWWSFPVALTCLSLLAAATLYTFWQSARGLRT